MSFHRQQAAVSPSNNINDKVDSEKVLLNRRKAIPDMSRANQVPFFNPRKSVNDDTPIKRLELTTKQSEFIADTIRDIRQKELESRANKRVKTDHALAFPFGDETNVIDFVDEMELRPDTAQILATAGGLVTIWNDAFLDVVKPTTSLSQIPLTIFELVEPESLHKLYEMLAVALDEYTTAQDGTSMSHLSIILPAKRFRQTDMRYEVTIVFMDNVFPKERCFVGWIKPVRLLVPLPHSRCISLLPDNDPKDTSTDSDVLPSFSSPKNLLPRGTILRLVNSTLCRLLREE